MRFLELTEVLINVRILRRESPCIFIVVLSPDSQKIVGKLTHGMNIAKVPDPCVLKTDGFSSGVKSMEPFLVKIFLSAESWQVSHELMRVIPTYGSFKFKGKLYERGKTGAGLFNTLICALTSKTFPNSDCPPIGLTMYKRSVIKFTMDNGSGNLHVSKKVERTKSLQTFCEEFDPSAMFA